MTFARAQEAQDFLDQNPDIDTFELFILDANGVPRGKLLHREELLAVYQSGRPLPSTILGLTLNGEDVEDSGLVWDVGDIDCRAYPLPGSLVRLPWRRMPTAALQVCMHPEEGMPAAIADPRHLLVQVIDQLKADGYHPVMACELEFYLLDQKNDAQGRPQPALDTDGRRPRTTQVYGLRELEQIEPFLADLYAACKAQGIPARTAISEYAPGQVEITLEHGDALTAMDQAVRYKRLVKGVANAHGMRACFMAKPFDHLAGTGMHMHVSLADAQGRNLFASEDPAGTPLLRLAVGGMLESLLDSLLLFCPNANSYRRFQANSYAPLAPTWGVDNRTVSLRVPGGPAASRHVEHRICGADANPYLAAAAILAGIHRGLRDEIDPGEPVQGNGYAQATERLPTDWLTALRALEASTWAREAFGEAFLGVYLAVKRAEYRQFMAEVSEQDWRWYMDQA
ncbi:glutamine synthetase family protein [Metapseudomonas otitidis]|jgi:glutamine synthetase|uniref:glutamine synthetase family protein n=2 Tax=Metapseudomonas otitidis TaxID=319939 RepID=UPI001CA3BC80|nr:MULTISPECIES: glutamine synthetase family protein [Pseudomonas]MDL5601354.1 glutamine synthetase family protein [Bacillus subtilis]MDG9783005.1 glutamine synthetase family protein [Pseudomonas otitidis]MDH0335834.1 glutamine synthetase family protein [Pseudomonas otitidis]MEE1892002.1 glutamine synthetase family protein [Pseudomonas otitidis]QZX82020.1 glutamine synthetase family protein [Pseudomonas otitidis]